MPENGELACFRLFLCPNMPEIFCKEGEDPLYVLFFFPLCFKEFVREKKWIPRSMCDKIRL